MWMISAFFLLFNENEVVLPYHFTTPVINAVSEDQWLISDYYGSGFQRVDGNGKVLQNVNFGRGEGPGEFKNARYIIDFPGENTTVVIGKHGDVNTFESDSGKFKEKIIRFLPYVGAVKWDEKHFLILWGKNVLDEKAKDSFILFDLKGNQVDAWEVPQPKWQEKFVYQVQRGATIDSERTAYFGSMEKPTLFVYKFKEKQQRIWDLKPPKGYQAPPPRTLNREEMINREKLQEYMDSFSFINNIFSVEGKYLVVAWNNAGGKKQTFDLYRFSDRKLLSSDNEVDGNIVAVSSSHVISHFTEDNSTKESEEKSVFRKYLLFEESEPGK